MRLATYAEDGRPRLGLVRNGEIAPAGLDLPDVGAYLRRAADDPAVAAAVADPAGPWRPIETVRLLPPLLAPRIVAGIGRNYGAHAAEGGLSGQERPRVFFKTPNAIVGPDASVRRPPGIAKLDYEAELVAVVGRRLEQADEADAAAGIAGFTAGNDLSAREFQFDVSPPQTSLAKSMDGFAPIGPGFVGIEETGPNPDLPIACIVNGERRQSARTGDLIFPVTACLAWISRFVTLLPGDLLFTGTPAGVGAFRDPPAYLVEGDVVDVRIESIGTLRTTIAGETPGRGRDPT